MLRSQLRRGILNGQTRTRGLLLLPGIICLASLTYCGLHSESAVPNQKSLTPNSFPADPPSRDAAVFDLTVGSDVVLRGTTTLGPWSSISRDPQARLVLFTDGAEIQKLFDEIDTGRLRADHLTLRMNHPPIAKLAVPVMSLRGSSEGMDRDMHSALKASEHPRIEYDLRNVQDAEIDRDPKTSEPQVVLHAIGTLSVAGVQRNLATALTIQRLASRRYRVLAETQMRMTDFDVTPPTALFGLIRADNSVAVIFKLEFAEAGVETAQAALPEAVSAANSPPPRN
jgi:hypothetical protein